MSPFSAPFFWGTPKREAAAPNPSGCISGGAQEIFGGFAEDLLGGDGKAEGAKVPGAGIGPKQCPEKMSGRKSCPTELGRSADSGRGTVSSSSGTQKDLLSRTNAPGATEGLDSSDRSDGERRMAVANALGQSGSKTDTNITD